MGSEWGRAGGQGVTRRLSRVESLRRLLLGASQQEARRLFDRRKQRYTVDKSIGRRVQHVFSSMYTSITYRYRY